MKYGWGAELRVSVFVILATPLPDFIYPSDTYADAQLSLCLLCLLVVAVCLGSDVGLSAKHCVISRTPDGVMVGDAR